MADRVRNAPTPLSDLRVLELGTGIAGSYCTKSLSALGAEVIKVEPPGGDPIRRRGPFVRHRYGPEASLLFLYLGTGKLSVTLDVASATGSALLGRLIDVADVIIDSSGSTAASPDWTRQRLASHAPGAIVVSVTPFGPDGPYHGYLDSELTMLALGGLLNMVGSRASAPLRLGGHQSQYQTGIASFAAVMTALHARDRDGQGDYIEVVEQEVVAFTEWKTAIYYQADGRKRSRGGDETYWMVLPCADGYVGLVYHDADWPQVQALADNEPALADARFASRAGRLAYRDDLRRILEAYTGRYTKEHLYTKGQALGVPLGMVADMSDLVGSPQYQSRGYFQYVDHPVAGGGDYPGPPLRVNSARPPSRRAPLLGEHNDLIFRDLLKLDDETLGRLRESGVV